MSSITLPTRGLVGLLEDLVHTTADPKLELPVLSAVLLHTAHGQWEFEIEDDDGSGDGGDPLFESAPSDLLVASSTSLSMIGQGHTVCTGRLHKPVLIDLLDVDSVIKVFKPLITKRLPKPLIHTTVVTYSGGTVIVAEDPDQVPGGKSVTMTTMDLDPFPRNLADLLAVDPTVPVVIDGDTVPVSYGTGLQQVHLAAIANVAKRRKMPVAWYRHHQRGRVVVEVGSSYRAVLMPLPLDDDQAGEPQVVVFDPPLPKREDVKTEPLVSV